MNSLTSEEIAYIAGIIDGEGSIMLIKFHNNQFYAPCVSISSTSIELLKWINHKLNTGTIKAKRNYNIDKHKNSYTYELKYNNAIELLNKVYPYLIINEKRERAILIINEYKKVTPRNGRYLKEMLEAKELFYEKFMKIR